ncbi:MAG: YicC/YloC family endoribonuclease [Eubacteriales bacterium]
MLNSMTAYGRAHAVSTARDVTVEIKSVNSRFFDCSVKLPRTHLFLEDKIKSYLQENGIARGKVDVFVNYEYRPGGTVRVSLDADYAAGYLAALRELQARFGLRDDLTVMSVARNPDLFTHTKVEADTDDEWAFLQDPLSRALADFKAMRAAEGERTRLDLMEKMASVAGLLGEIERLSKGDVSACRQRAEERIRLILADASASIDESKVLTECALYADKIAIDEELARLSAHIAAFHEMVALGGVCGKKLDFLTQELNRETNTIGAKANNAHIAHLVVNIKNELEKIREQIQNIE